MALEHAALGSVLRDAGGAVTTRDRQAQVTCLPLFWEEVGGHFKIQFLLLVSSTHSFSGCILTPPIVTWGSKALRKSLRKFMPIQAGKRAFAKDWLPTPRPISSEQKWLFITMETWGQLLCCLLSSLFLRDMHNILIPTPSTPSKKQTLWTLVRQLLLKFNNYLPRKKF